MIIKLKTHGVDYLVSGKLDIAANNSFETLSDIEACYQRYVKAFLTPIESSEYGSSIPLMKGSVWRRDNESDIFIEANRTIAFTKNIEETSLNIDDTEALNSITRLNGYFQGTDIILEIGLLTNSGDLYTNSFLI